jgi:hypothetical protein
MPYNHLQPTRPQFGGAERRRLRSENPEMAAELYLQSLASRGQHTTLALADPDGLLLAATGPIDAEAVAAVAPLADSGSAVVDGLLGLVTRGAPLHVWPVTVAGARCYLAAVGGAAATPIDAEAALNRIFA